MNNNYNITKYTANHLFFKVPATDFSKNIEKAFELIDFSPEILEKIEIDQDTYAKQKKEIRIADKNFHHDQNPLLFDNLYRITSNQNANDIELKKGRPRMTPQEVYLFLFIRGCIGSVSCKTGQYQINDSITVNIIYHNWNKPIPAKSTIHENLNAVSNETLEFIMDKQIEYILSCGLDDFSSITIDSTAIDSNTEWPTDSNIIYSLLKRVYNYIQKLSDFGLSSKKHWMETWLKKLKNTMFQIKLSSGRKNSAKKIKKNYRAFLKTAHKAFIYLTSEMSRLYNEIEKKSLKPSIKKQLYKCIDIIKEDLNDIPNVLYYTENRIFNGITLKSSEKILSITDKDAAFIAKGNRTPVIGYKPQVARSENGFISGITVPKGNTADSKELLPLVKRVISKTGITPKCVSTDDGYSSKDNYNDLTKLGVEVVSMSGAKGKKVTPDDLWIEEMYKDARRKRSAVESIMFTLKYSYSFGLAKRRGLKQVQAELYEKVIAYNFDRINLMLKKPPGLKKIA